MWIEATDDNKQKVDQNIGTVESNYSKNITADVSKYILLIFIWLLDVKSKMRSTITQTFEWTVCNVLRKKQS